MPKPLTKKDVENAFKGQSLLITRKIDRLREEVLTKKDAKKLVTKEDAKQFSTKQEAGEISKKIDELDRKREQDKQDIIREFRSSVELQKADLEGAHQDELASVEGKKDAPPQWKSMPRRLLKVEMDVEKIKDHLEIQ